MKTEMASEAAHGNAWIVSMNTLQCKEWKGTLEKYHHQVSCNKSYPALSYCSGPWRGKSSQEHPTSSPLPLWGHPICLPHWPPHSFVVTAVQHRPASPYLKPCLELRKSWLTPIINHCCQNQPASCTENNAALTCLSKQPINWSTWMFFR